MAKIIEFDPSRKSTSAGTTDAAHATRKIAEEIRRCVVDGDLFRSGDVDLADFLVEYLTELYDAGRGGRVPKDVFA